MPEHDLFDIDDAFSSLEREIATISSPRGASHAVASARRRRRTTYGAIAALAVLAVGGVAIGQGLGNRDGAVGPSDQAPQPAELTPAALSAATSGWIDGWVAPTQASQLSNADLTNLGCLASEPTPKGLENPARLGRTFYTTPGGQVGILTGFEYSSSSGGNASAAADALAATVASCHPTVTTPVSYGAAATVTFYELPATRGQHDAQLWTVRYGDRIAFLTIGGGSDAPSADTVSQVDDALVAAVQADATFAHVASGISGGGSNTKPSAPQFGTVAEPDFAAALGTWPNGWQQNGTKSTGDALPCTGNWTTGSSSGMGASLGSNGEQDFYGFDSVDSARSSLQALSANLQSCAASPATVRTVTGTGGTAVTVAVGSGKDGRVTWIVQRGATVGYLTIPGTTGPPDAVSEAVGGLVGDVLANVSEGPPPVESSTPVQQQGGGTSSSSSSAAAPKS
jgi:hypothetical protein